MAGPLTPQPAASLPHLTARLRAHPDELADSIDAVCDLIAAREPTVRALVTTPERRRLHDEAAALAAVSATDIGQAPLFGVLVGVKDIINVDGFPTRAGSTLPDNLFSGPEAAAVARLRSAGALVLGKTTTTEFAFSEPAPTTNPRDPSHTPGGSSSGSAAAVAAGYTPLALGTQTVDSVVTPAAYCGVVGFKPTFGRVPVSGVVPFAPAMDHIGWFATDVAGVELAARALVDGWRDVDPNPVPRVGIPADTYLALAAEDARTAFAATVAALGRAGCVVVSSDALEDVTALAAGHRRLIARQFAVQHEAWFAAYGAKYRTRTAGLYREGAALDDSVVAAGAASSEQLRSDLEGAMLEHSLDLWAGPAATGPAPHGLGSIGDPIMALPWTHAHLPVVTIPAGTAGKGLPLGLQLAGKYGADEDLVAFAAIIERMAGSPAQLPRS